MNQAKPENISLAEFVIWEQQQTDRFEWIAGTIVPYGGASSEHSTIISNIGVLLHNAVGFGPCYVQHADRQLIPRDKNNRDLGSFYADLFVSCAPEDRAGSAAHFPTVTVEILSPHVGEEFTGAKDWPILGRET